MQIIKLDSDGQSISYDGNNYMLTMKVIKMVNDCACAKELERRRLTII